MTPLLAAALLCASLTWDEVTTDVEGNPETVVASECEIIPGEGGAPHGRVTVGSQSCDLGLLVAGLPPGRYSAHVRVGDAAGNWSAWSNPLSIALFLRGDANSDGEVNLADTVALLLAFFAGGSLACHDAADANDDGTVDIADPIRILLAMFGGATIPEPFPGLGVDVTADALGCFEVVK